jgi:hypothetical protein
MAGAGRQEDGSHLPDDLDRHSEHRMNKDKVKLFSKYFKKWTNLTGLLWWKITVIYYGDPAEIVEHFTSGNDTIVAARTTADWRYMTAKIIVNVNALTDMDEEEIESLAVHELCHILVNEMRENDLHHEERVVSCLAHAFIWTAEKDDLPVQGNPAARRS